MKLQRMCAVCREMKSKDELLRVVNQKGTVSIDLGGKLQGRGAYLCKDGPCVSKARKARALERSFSGRVDGEIYDALEGMVLGG